jgi:heme ABC exporter ATP-binding subunit CcmA
LQLRGLEMQFGRLRVLHGVDLRLEAGELVGLVGANGAGKTTLLSIIAGLVMPTRGTVAFGRCGSVLTTRQRGRLAFVAHSAQLYPRLTARENLQLFADLRIAAGLSAEPIDPLIERLGLGHARDRMTGTFSRGMLQRLALARALIGRPELLLMDEPFTALDHPGRELLATVIAGERRRGAAILLSSHHFDAVAAVSDRTVLLRDGRVAGTVERGADDALGDDRYRDGVQSLVGQLVRRSDAEAEISGR